MPEAIHDLARLAGQYARQSHSLTGTIVKELLHYEILYGLSRTELKRCIVFQGGTALRLCYGGNRYSEDLDFVLEGKQADVELNDLMTLLPKQIARHYGLEVDFKLPKGKTHPQPPEVRRWQVVVRIPALRHSQKINIKICDVPSYDNEYHLIQANYPHLPQAYRQITLRVESLIEILADKIVALGARRYVKARDIWDIHFLKTRGRTGIDLDVNMVQKKLQDYRLNEDEFRVSLERRTKEITKVPAQKAMLDELSRFVDPEFFETVLETGIIAQQVRTAVVTARELLESE